MPINALSSKILGLQLYNIKNSSLVLLKAGERMVLTVLNLEEWQQSYTTKAEGEKYRYWQVAKDAYPGCLPDSLMPQDVHLFLARLVEENAISTEESSNILKQYQELKEGYLSGSLDNVTAERIARMIADMKRNKVKALEDFPSIQDSILLTIVMTKDKDLKKKMQDIFKAS